MPGGQNNKIYTKYEEIIKGDKYASPSSSPNPVPGSDYRAEILQDFTYTIKSKSLTHVKWTGKELTKLPKQLIAFILLLQLYCMLNLRGTFCSFPQILCVSVSSTEAKATQHHYIYRNLALYLEYKTSITQGILDPYWQSYTLQNEKV